MEIKYKTDLDIQQKKKAYRHVLELIDNESPAVNFLRLDILEVLFGLDLIKFNNVDDTVQVELTQRGTEELIFSLITSHGINKGIG